MFKSLIHLSGIKIHSCNSSSSTGVLYPKDEWVLKKLKNVTSDASPIHWQHGAIARLPKHAPIYPLLQDGYATITLGYIGVYECVKSLLGVSHTTPEGEKLAL